MFVVHQKYNTTGRIARFDPYIQRTRTDLA